MARPKNETPPVQGPPIQFRPLPAYNKLVKQLIADKGVRLNDAYKNLAALSIVGLDVRHYDLIARLAKVCGGVHAFTHACLAVHAALNGADLAGRKFKDEKERLAFVETVVNDTEAKSKGTES